MVRVVEGLARRGWPYRIFSLEKPGDLAQPARVNALRARLASAGVDWRFEPYESDGRASSAARNEGKLVQAAMATKNVLGIHARAYHSAVAAFSAWFTNNIPYLFDARSYWFDERLEEGRWFTTPLRLAIARGVEHQLFAQASGVVTLTELQADDVRQGRFGASQHRAVQCIPTCADFDDFTRQKASARIPETVRETLEGKSVVGIVGSINRSYLVDETLRLAAEVLRRDENAHLLVLSGQSEEYARRLTALGVDARRTTLTRADHEAMPQWLSLMDWGMLLLNPDSPAKRASMPTKLAEFLACGVRPVQFGCNAEVSDWVRRTGLGFVLSDVSAQSLEEAAQRIATHVDAPGAVEKARALAAPHFSLAAGLQKYERVLLETFGDIR